ncbi:MAG TPA: SLC13 family permease [Gemmatimonadales bacterium]|nr:SLC13 family permease [Gemmatimonadales bacterium]
MHSESLLATTDPVSQALVGALLVILFVLLTREKAHRVLLALGAVSLLWLLTYLTPWHLVSLEGASRALDLNVLLLLAGMMAVVGVLKSTGVFEWMVARMLEGRINQPLLVLTILTWVTAVSSAFLDNVTTVIFIAPIAVGVARQLKVDARALLLPVIMAANIGGTATLIGDPPNILIGSAANLSFVSFLVTLGPPVLLMMLVFDMMAHRRYQGALSASPEEEETQVVPPIVDPALLKGMAWICGFILVGFLTHGLTGMPAAIPAVIGAAAALFLQDVLYLRTAAPSDEERQHGILHVLENDIEWPTLVFFALLFITVGAAVETGLIESLARALESGIMAGRDAMGLGESGTLLFAALLILWVSGVMSGLIDNIPFVAVSIPILADLTATLPGETTVLWWALALGACLGGNFTPIGASANVTTLDIAARRGTRVTFKEFLAVGVPITAMTLMLSSLWLAGYVWFGNTLTALACLTGAALLIAPRLLRFRARTTA